MIIQCESCSRKFIVKDQAIPKKGRTGELNGILVNWYNESVKGDETGEEWMNAPEGLWRKLSKLFANEVNQ